MKKSNYIFALLFFIMIFSSLLTISVFCASTSTYVSIYPGNFVLDERPGRYDFDDPHNVLDPYETNGYNAFFRCVAIPGAQLEWQFKSPSGNEWKSITESEEPYKLISKYNNSNAYLYVYKPYGKEGNTYRCKITGDDGAVAYTKEVKVYDMHLKLYPADGKYDVYADVGSTVNLSFNTEIYLQSGDEIINIKDFTVSCDYEKNNRFKIVVDNSWMYMKQSQTTGVNVSSVKPVNGQLTLKNITPSFHLLRYKFRPRISFSLSGFGNLPQQRWFESDYITLHVGPKELETKITKQPQNLTLHPGEIANFTIKASNAAKYQWQYYSKAKKAWVNSGAEGNKTDSLKIKTKGEYHNLQYRCLVKNSLGVTTHSDIVTLSFSTVPVIIECSPRDNRCGAGETVVLYVKAKGEGLTYQWKYYSPDNKTNIWPNSLAKGAKTDTLYVTFPYRTKNGYYRINYFCVVTDKYGTSVVSPSFYTGGY